MRIEEEVDQQGLDRRLIVADLVIARGRKPRQLQPVQGRFARHRRAVLASGFKLARQNRHHRVVTKVVVVVQVLVAERDGEHALPDERGDRVLDEPRVSGVAKTSRKPPNHLQASIRGPQKQAASVRGQGAAVERRHHWTAFDRSKQARFCATLCQHRAILPNQFKSFSQNNFCLIRRPDAPPCVRNAG
jgi:hypothetical protein